MAFLIVSNCKQNALKISTFQIKELKVDLTSIYLVKRRKYYLCEISLLPDNAFEELEETEFFYIVG